MIKSMVGSFQQLKQKADKETVWMLRGSIRILLIKGFGSGIQFIQALVVIRLFGLEANGILALFISLVKGFGLLSVFGLDNLTMREVSTLKNDQDLKNKFKKWYSSYIIVILLTFFISVFVFSGVYFLVSIKTLWILVCITLLPVTFLKIFSFYSMGLLKTVRYAIIEFAAPNSIFLVLLGLWYLARKSFPEDRFLPFLFAIGIFILASICFILLLRKDINIEISFLFRSSASIAGKIKLHFRNAIAILQKAYHFLLSNAAIVMTATLISIVISSRLSATSMGIYDAVLKISQLAVIPLMGINGVLSPKIASYYHNGELNRMKKQVYAFTLISSIVSFVVTAILLFLFRPIIHFVNSSLQTYMWLFCLLLIAQMLNVVTGPVGLILQMTREEKVFNKIILVASIVYLGGSYLLIRKVGLDLVGYAYIIFIGIINISATYFVYKKFKFIPAMAFYEIFRQKKKQTQ